VRKRIIIFMMACFALFLTLASTGCSRRYANSGYVQGLSGIRYEGHRINNICDCFIERRMYAEDRYILDGYIEASSCPLRSVIFYDINQLELFDGEHIYKAAVDEVDTLLNFDTFFYNYMFILSPTYVTLKTRQSYEIYSVAYNNGVLTVNMVLVYRESIFTACNTWITYIVNHAFIIIIPRTISTDTQVVFKGAYSLCCW